MSVNPRGGSIRTSGLTVNKTCVERVTDLVPQRVDETAVAPRVGREVKRRDVEDPREPNGEPAEQHGSRASA